MKKTLRNGWSVTETDRGLEFMQHDSWEDVLFYSADLLKYRILGIFEDNGSLILAMRAEDKLPRLLKITPFEDGRFNLQTTTVRSTDLGNILMAFCRPEAEDTQARRQIVEE